MARQTRNSQATLPDRTSSAESQCKAFTEVNDSFEDDYQAARFYRKPKTRIETNSNYSSNSIITQSYNKRHATNCGGTKSTLKRPRSSCSSNSSTTSQNGLTRLRLVDSRKSLVHGVAKNSTRVADGSRSSRESSHNRTVTSCRDSSTESLDRIHTFNLRQEGQSQNNGIR